MRRSVLTVFALLAACSRTPTPGDGPKPNGKDPSGGPPGAVTVHFQNDSNADLFVEAPTNDAIDVKSGERGLPRGHFCQDFCGPQCVCKRCGEAMPMVQIVPAGGAIDVVWKGDYFVDGTCQQGANSCGCNDQKFLSSGPATITLRGRRATRPVKPASISSGTFNAELEDTSSGCTATVDVVVSEKPQTVAAKFACDG